MAGRDLLYRALDSLPQTVKVELQNLEPIADLVGSGGLLVETKIGDQVVMTTLVQSDGDVSTSIACTLLSCPSDEEFAAAVAAHEEELSAVLARFHRAAERLAQVRRFSLNLGVASAGMATTASAVLDMLVVFLVLAFPPAILLGIRVGLRSIALSWIRRKMSELGVVSRPRGT